MTYFIISESHVAFAPVGFTAYAESDKTYYNYEPIEFTGVIGNIGNSHDASHIVFTCPFRGVYMFSLIVKAESAYYGFFQILRDGGFLCEAWADSDEHCSTHWSLVISHYSIVAALVVKCEAGQALWV